jgi:hypothetical protein
VTNNGKRIEEDILKTSTTADWSKKYDIKFTIKETGENIDFLKFDEDGYLKYSGNTIPA